MLLAIDVGNTNIVFALYRDGAFLPSWRLETDVARGLEGYSAFLSPFLAAEGIAPRDISAAIVSSVVPGVDDGLTEFCEAFFGCDPVFVSRKNVGIDVDIDKPEEVGADRLVNAVAVKAHYQYPAIVIDFGTATTFDVIDGNGAYGGGVIAPGVNLSMEILHRAAAKLPKVSVEKPDCVIGKNTKEAIQAGAYYGYLGLIEGVVARITAELGSEPYVLATGGLAHLFAPGTEVIDRVDDDLTLKGLLYIHQNM